MTAIIITGVLCFGLGATAAVGGLCLFAWALASINDDQMAEAHADVPGRGR